MPNAHQIVATAHARDGLSISEVSQNTEVKLILAHDAVFDPEIDLSDYLRYGDVGQMEGKQACLTVAYRGRLKGFCQVVRML